MASANDDKTPLTQASTLDYGGVAPYAGEADDSAKEDGGNTETQWSIFPLEPFKYLPPACTMLLPGPWTKIVSLPHLVLLLASFTSLAVLVESVSSWADAGCRTYFCQGRIAPIAFVAFCIMYFFTTIQQYDERLQRKQQELQEAKRALDKRYEDMVQDLEGYLSKSLETQVLMAERGFESHRRDFHRFLQKYVEKLQDAGVASDEASLNMFRSFVRRWLTYFSECSIDPVDHPLLVIASEELDQCTTHVEIATVVSERLSNMEVQFVSSQREKDQEEISSVRSSWTKKALVQKKALALKEAVCGRVPAFHAKGKDPESGTLTFDNELSKGGQEALDEYRWVQWGRSAGLGIKRDEDTQDTQDRLPMELHLGCVTIVLLSVEHIRLILAFFMGVVVLMVEGYIAFMIHYNDQGIHQKGFEAVFLVIKDLKFSMIFETIICMTCIGFILHEFLDMDIVQQLDAQLRQLEAAQLQVMQKRERILSFYTATQELGDLWLHRTIPQLELMKYFYEKLIDLPVKQHVELIKGIEQQMGALEQSTPPLLQWRGDEVIGEKKKKVFDTTVMQLVGQNLNIEEMLVLMPQCNRDIRIAFGIDLGELALKDEKPIALKPSVSLAVTATKDDSALKVGTAVEYWSRWGRWIPAQVIRIDPTSGLLDLDCREQVKPDRVRPLPPLGTSEEQESKSSWW